MNDGPFCGKMKKEYLVTTDEMKAYDSTTINEIGIDSLVLMERAALKVTERGLYHYKSLKRNETDSSSIGTAGRL